MSFFAVIPLILVYQIPTINYDSNIIMALVIILYSSFKLTLLSSKGTKRIIDLAFWLFVYVWLGLASYTQILTGRFPWFGMYSQFEIFSGYMTVLIGLISYDFGQYLSRRRITKHPIQQMNLDGIQQEEIFLLTTRKFYFLTLFSTFLVLFIGFTKLHGNFFISRGGFTAYFQSSTDLLVYSNLLRVPVFVSLIIALTFLVKGKNYYKKSKLIFYPTLILLFILNVLVNNPVSNPRFWFGTVFLSICFIILKWSNRSSFSIWAFSFVMLLILIFPYADIFRHTLDSQLQVVETYRQLSANGDYDAFQQILNTLRYVDSFDYSYGMQFLGDILFWVPRNLWEGKPFGTGAVVADGLGYDFLNLSAPLWAESYINFGFIGVVIIFVLYGMLIEKIQHIYINKTQKNLSILDIFVPYFASYQFFFLRGDLLNGTAVLTCFIVFAILGSRLNKNVWMKHKFQKNTNKIPSTHIL